MANTTSEKLTEMKADAEWARANPGNPICSGGCDRRCRPEDLKWPLLDGTLVCAECQDDERERVTGSRF